MTPLAGLFLAFVVLTLIVVAGLVVLLRRRLASDGGSEPERPGREPFVPSGTEEE